MALLILSVDIGPGDHRPVRSIYSEFIKEARKGRRPDQISINGSLVVIQTPETAEAAATRIVTAVRLNPAFDRLSVMDPARKTMLLWGLSDDAAPTKFPLLIHRLT